MIGKLYTSTDEITNTPVDRLARTYCAMEELAAWLDRVDAGEKLHQEEINRQAESKIVRLQTAAALGAKP